MTQSVLDVVLDQLDLAPTEYFQRLSQSLDEARVERLERASVSHDTDDFIQDEVAAPPSLSVLPDEDVDLDELTMVEPGAEEPLAPAAAARARAKKPSRARATRPVADEDEDELAEFGLEPLTDDESQFRQAYRRALRTNRRPFRER